MSDDSGYIISSVEFHLIRDLHVFFKDKDNCFCPKYSDPDVVSALEHPPCISKKCFYFLQTIYMFV